MMGHEIQGELPLTEASLYILLSLSPEPKHGYAILKEVEALSKGRVQLSTGTLYGAIKRMLEKDWIHQVKAAPGQESGRNRKEYALTVQGWWVLKAEVERLNSLVEIYREIAPSES